MTSKIHKVGRARMEEIISQIETILIDVVKAIHVNCGMFVPQSKIVIYTENLN